MDDQAIQNNAGGLGLFGDDDEDELDHPQLQQQQYQDDLDADDILGLDDDAGAIENPEGSLLMRFCPHDSSMLYPKVKQMFIFHVLYLLIGLMASDNLTTINHLIERKIAPNANYYTPAVSAATQNMPKGH
jgi:hypothetical protein